MTDEKKSLPDHVTYECVRCEGIQKELRSVRVRHQNVRCKSCGYPAYPTADTLEKEKKDRKCKRCGAVLRKGNPKTVCSSCTAVEKNR